MSISGVNGYGNYCLTHVHGYSGLNSCLCDCDGNEYKESEEDVRKANSKKTIQEKIISVANKKRWKHIYEVDKGKGKRIEHGIQSHSYDEKKK
jgi:hypothetical protein